MPTVPSLLVSVSVSVKVQSIGIGGIGKFWYRSNPSYVTNSWCVSLQLFAERFAKHLTYVGTTGRSGWHEQYEAEADSQERSAIQAVRAATSHHKTDHGCCRRRRHCGRQQGRGPLFHLSRGHHPAQEAWLRAHLLHDVRGRVLPSLLSGEVSDVSEGVWRVAWKPAGRKVHQVCYTHGTARLRAMQDY